MGTLCTLHTIHFPCQCLSARPDRLLPPIPLDRPQLSTCRHSMILFCRHGMHCEGPIIYARSLVPSILHDPTPYTWTFGSSAQGHKGPVSFELNQRLTCLGAHRAIVAIGVLASARHFGYLAIWLFALFTLLLESVMPFFFLFFSFCLGSEARPLNS